MVHTSSGNQQLVRQLIEDGILKSPDIIAAFLAVDRRVFVPEALAADCYGDFPLPIGQGQTISQPTTVAIMLELLRPTVGCRVLDIGSGSGYTSAILGRIVGDQGRVLGLERLPALVQYGRDRIRKIGLHNVEINQAGARLGIPNQRFDRILVSAAAREFPQSLIRQLDIGASVVIPVDDCIVYASRVSASRTEMQSVYGFSFVPLIYEAEA